MGQYLSVGEVSKVFDTPAWKVRRVVDELDPKVVRAGNYRLIPRDLLESIAGKLRGDRQGGADQ